MSAILIDHIGIVVRDIPAALEYYRDILGLPFEGLEKMEAFKVDIAFFSCGDTLVELLQPTGEGSFQEFLEKNGEGFHHIAFRVGNIVEELDYLKKKGIPLVDKVPKIGGGGALIAFLEASAVNNVSTELVQREIIKGAKK